MKRQYDLVLDDSDEDDVVVATTSTSGNPEASTSRSVLPLQPSAEPTSASTSGNWRAQLDAERRARQLSRRRADGQGSSSPEPAPAPGPVGRAQSPQPLDQATGPKGKRRFWKPTIARVSNKFHEDDDGYTLREALGDDAPKEAIASAYCWNLEWALPHFDPSTKLLLIMPKHRNDQAGIRQMLPEIRRDTYIVQPPMQADSDWGVMHVKLFILFFHDRCRILIPTANCETYDWDVIDNMFFIQDFPMLDSAVPNGESDRNATFNSNFTAPLLRMLGKMGVPRAWTSPLSRYDFSDTLDVHLVYSQPGKWDVDASDPSSWNAGGGFPALAHAITSLGLTRASSWSLEAAGSSFGRLTPIWLKQMLSTASGLHPSTYFDGSNRLPRHLRDKESASLPISLIFPTLRQVESSILGKEGAGTLFFPSKQWTATSIHRPLMKQGKSTREGALAHTKLYLGLPTSDGQSSLKAADNNVDGWFYLGSHNFTMAAWGEIVVSRNKPQVRIYNWELGVVMPLRATSKADLENKLSTLVTFRRPLEPYLPTDAPWRQDCPVDGLPRD